MTVDCPDQSIGSFAFAAVIVLTMTFATLQHAAAQDNPDRSETPTSTDKPASDLPDKSDAETDEVTGLIQQIKQENFDLARAKTKDEAKSSLDGSAKLITELSRVTPNNSRIIPLMDQRWRTYRKYAHAVSKSDGGLAVQAFKSELNQSFETATNPDIKTTAAFFLTVLKLDGPIDGIAAAEIVNGHLRQWPNDPHAPELLQMTIRELRQSAEIRALLTLILFPVAIAICILAYTLNEEWAKRHAKSLQLTRNVAIVLLALGVLVVSSDLFTSALIRSSSLQSTIRLARWKLFGIMRRPQFGVLLLAAVSFAAFAPFSKIRNLAPKRPIWLSAAMFCSVLAVWFANDAKKIDKIMTELRQRLADEYPDSNFGRIAQGQIRRENGIGKSFELDFTDAISGKQISMQALRGQVVVIDFWATWCGPCRGEMPEMKHLYAKYHNQGVEFIGISQDAPVKEGGRDALKKFVAEQDIPWPQFHYDEEQPTGETTPKPNNPSTTWGVNEIPTVFIIDRQGNLYSTEARGQLDKLIPQLLKKTP